MKKSFILGVGAVALLAIPLAASAVPEEGHFSGRAEHNGSPGVYTVGNSYTTYQTLDTFQGSNGTWYPWGSDEYTLVISTTVASYDGVSNPQSVTFGPTSFTIYEDAGTAADYSNVGTFTDGTAVLTGTISGMAGSRVNIFGLPWGITGNVSFTGGTGLASVTPCVGGVLLMNDFINFEIPFGGWPDAQGFEEAYDTKWDCEPETTGTEDSTWGQVKALYQ